MKLRDHFTANWQKYVNIYLFLNIAGYGLWQIRKLCLADELHYAEISFAVQNLALCAVILLRSDHKAIDNSVWHQVVALAAFFSGILMLGQHPATLPAAREISGHIILLANILGILTIFNLGRSFGILIAMREVKTGGLYRMVRHPMYATDLLLRIGYFIGHLTVLAGLVTVFSIVMYYWRATLEEEFLSRDPGYQVYMQKVRYRFIPFVI